MASTIARSCHEVFFRNLASAQQRLLLLDYDGTIAPFTPHRDRAFPYPQVQLALEDIMALGTTRVVIITGRDVKEIPSLLRLQPLPEIWGSHGLERLCANGNYSRLQISEQEQQSLSIARALLDGKGLTPYIESKPGGIAIHWRGVSGIEAQSVKNAALEVLTSSEFGGTLRVQEFDGGIEIRLRGIDKGAVLRVLQAESVPSAAIAYLGDDLTDEDAFHAMDSRGLAVLVREEFRRTAAQLWLRPPEELVGFLSMWLDACGGHR